MALNEVDLQRWKRVTADATPGPWRATPFGLIYAELPTQEQIRANDEFTAAARTAVPALITEVERLRKELDRALEQLP